MKGEQVNMDVHKRKLLHPLWIVIKYFVNTIKLHSLSVRTGSDRFGEKALSHMQKKEKAKIAKSRSNRTSILFRNMA
jgi:hypothetical protein